MAKLFIAPKGKMQETINEVTTAHKAQSLAGGLALPLGDHKLIVADKKAFGILLVESKASGEVKNWALPIVAGTVGKEAFVLSAEAGAKTLVIPDQFIVDMQPNGAYTITIGERKGRKVVTNVVLADGVEADENDEENDD